MGRCPAKWTRITVLFQFPTIIPVIDHLAGHATVNADVLTCNEACLVGTEEQHHIGYVHGCDCATTRMW